MQPDHMARAMGVEEKLRTKEAPEKALVRRAGQVTRCPAVTDLLIQCFNLDSTDPQRTAGFWQETLGWRRTHDTRDQVVLEPPAGSPQDGVAPDLLFLRVPEGKEVKNRWHPDLRPEDQAAEVARLEALGATRIDLGQRPDQTFVAMADPDGNEFCVLRAFTQDELDRWAAENATNSASVPA